MSANKQTIAQALRTPAIRRALNELVGCPVGGWGDTDMARRRLVDALPWRADRSYSASDLISAALTVDIADRYRWREEEVAS